MAVKVATDPAWCFHCPDQFCHERNCFTGLNRDLGKDRVELGTVTDCHSIFARRNRSVKFPAGSIDQVSNREFCCFRAEVQFGVVAQRLEFDFRGNQATLAVCDGGRDDSRIKIDRQHLRAKTGWHCKVRGNLSPVRENICR